MKLFIRFTAVSLTLLMGVSCLQAQNAVGFDFLRTFVGARPAAMAGAFVAMPGDIHNLAYNPAGLTELEPKRHGTATYLNHLLDFQSGFLAYAQPFQQGTIAAGVHFFDYGQLEGKDESGNATGDFGANSVAFSVGYARRFFDSGALQNLLLGGAAKFIRFQIDNFTSTALALDLGMIYMIPSQQLTIGLAVFNWGTTTSAFIETKDDLPLNYQIGISKKLAHLPLTYSISLAKFSDDDFDVHVGGIDDIQINGIDLRLGGEFILTEQLFLRLGYSTVGQDQKVDTGKDRLAGVSLGLGFKANSINVDYSFSSFGEVGSLNRVTLIGRF